MKNTINTLHLLFLIATMTTFGITYAQPPCDPLTVYDAVLDRNGNSTMPIYIYITNGQIEYFPLCPEPEDIELKHITFIHGLAGSGASWAKPRKWTNDNYKGGASNITYAGWEQGFDEAGTEANTAIGNRLENGHNQMYPDRCKTGDYVIAHSQGGVVARWMDKEWTYCELFNICNSSFGNRKFHGIVTIGTPNDGAHIGLTADEHGKLVAKVINNIVFNDISEAAFNLTDKWFISSSLKNKILNYVNNGLQQFLADVAAPIILEDLHSTTLFEMLPESPTINNLRTLPTRVNRAAFYSIEDAPEIWRVLDMVMTQDASEYDTFASNYDEAFMNTMEYIRDEHEAEIKRQEISYKINAANRSVYNQIINKTTNSMKKNLTNIKVRQERVDFLNNANSTWRYLIGSYHRDSFDVITTTKYIVSYQIVGYPYNTWTREFSNYDNAYSFSQSLNANTYMNISTSSTTQTTRSQSFFPSDGVVLAKSQKAFPGVREFETDIMRHNNHFEQRNSSETKRILENLYEGDHGDFFKMEKK